jgi:transposase
MPVERKKQLSDETRKTIIKKYNQQKSIKTISEELDLNYQTVASVVRIFRLNGRIFAQKSRNVSKKKLSENDTTFIKTAIENDVSITLNTIKVKLHTERGVAVSRSTINRSICDFNFSFKRLQLIPEMRNSSSNIEKRYAYATEYLQYDQDKVVFLDEFGANCSIRSAYGRSQIGTTPRKNIRAIRSKNFSISAAMAKNTLLFYEVIDRPYNGERYYMFLHDLLRILREKNLTSMILVMDNLPVHKVDIIKNLIIQNGHNLVFLPPYSPQLNPIEEVFSKWKNEIKILNPNNFSELETAIRNGHNSITDDDCRAYFRHTRQYAVKATRREEF